MGTNNKKFGLGRGLEALLGEEEINLDFDDQIDLKDIGENTVFKSANGREVMVSDVVAGPFQPRTKFDDKSLADLSESIKKQGVLQPILVRPRNGRYEIVAGERRWRAAQLAGLNLIPAIVKDIKDKDALEIALIENLQRENLSPIEEALGYEKLQQEYGYKQEELAEHIGKSRSYITNTLRLLSLPEKVRTAIQDEKISAGHGRALVGVENSESLLNQVIAKNLSVRQTEELVAKLKQNPLKAKAQKTLDRELQNIVRDLEQKLKLKVKINAGQKGKGSVTLHYNNPAELSSILDLLEQR